MDKRPIRRFTGLGAQHTVSQKHITEGKYRSTNTSSQGQTPANRVALHAHNSQDSSQQTAPFRSYKIYLKLSLKYGRIALRLFKKQHPWLFRLLCLLVAVMLAFSIWLASLTPHYNAVVEKQLDTIIQNMLGAGNDRYAAKLVFSSKDNKYTYNAGYSPRNGSTGDSSSPKFTAEFHGSDDKTVIVNDTVNQVGLAFKPKFPLEQPRKNKNRVIYKLGNRNAAVVYSLQGSGAKEDIIVPNYQTNEMSFEYDLGLDLGTEPRIESDGSLGVYGVSNIFLGNISTGSQKDEELIKKAKENGPKDSLLFRIPAPFVVEQGKKSSSARAWFTLNDKLLTVHADALKNASYPLSIDPSIYIETAAKLMRGNNESNTSFDVTNELVQKAKVSGARIDGWADSTEMNSGVWDQSMAAAGGYIYRAGGRQDPTVPYITSQQSSVQSSASASFVMNMPTIRPAGDLYVAIIAHRGTTAVTPPGGWTQIANTREHAAFYRVGTNVSGGNEASSYTFTGGTVEWAGTMLRIKGYDSTTPISGTAGTGSNASAAAAVFPTTTPSHDSTLVIRSASVSAAQPSTYGWLPSGHTAVYAATSSTATATSAAVVVSTLDAPPLASNATGTSTITDDNGTMTNTYGASSVAIKGATVTAGVQTSVQWAKFNTSTAAINSPNPGNGTCTGWCNDSAYDLPVGRIGMSLVAYNGFLYAMGGTDGTTRASTVYIAKLGANGEPSLWHPSGGTKVFWYTDTGLNGGTARSYFGAVAYNNRMYVLGGQTNASAGGVATVEKADIGPTGTLGSWTTTGMQALPDVRHGFSVHVYNDVMYLIGGNSNGTLRNTVYYSKLNSDGTMNPWTATTSFTTARSSFGGMMTTVYGAYIYIAGGCTALTSGFCSTVASDVQLASINTDGTIAEWNTMSALSNQRIAYNLVGWQGGLYRFGGCNRQNTSTGVCYSVHQDSDFGVINQDGDASTVSISSTSGSGTCTGGTPTNCDLPPIGDNAGQGGQMYNMVVVNNGFIYSIGGCADVSTTRPCDSGAGMSGNIVYAAISSTGTLVAPPTCNGTSYGMWCVDSTNRIGNGTQGLGTAGSTVFNNRIYVVGGTGNNQFKAEVEWVALKADGSLSGAWNIQTFSSISLNPNTANEAIGFSYVFSRANPNSTTNPGNMYVLGGCNGANGVECTTFFNEVIKCNIASGGGIAATSCTKTGQLQIDSDNINTGSQGLGIMGGAVYANYVYLAGGSCPSTGSTPSAPCGSTYFDSRRDIIYAQIDSNNNIVAASGGGGNWAFTSFQINPVRQRLAAFGYNGYLYTLAGYNSTGTLRDLAFAKINVSTGDIGAFTTSAITVSQRWGLQAGVSNGYIYTIGGCAVGAAPTGCTSMQPQIQTFQLYNNNSGAPISFAATSSQSFATDTDRWGASAAVVNGVMYVAGGCVSATDCTTASSNVQKATISATDGTVGSWTNTTAALPAVRTWGSLRVAGGYLYYLGGQDSTATNEQSTIYYALPASGDITSWSTATKAIGDTGSGGNARTKFGATVWNNRIYVVGGLDGSAAATSTVYVSPQLNSGGDITSNWTSTTAFNVARSGNAVTSYANNLYVLGGYDGTNYLGDTQFAPIASSGTVGTWSYGSSIPGGISQGVAFAANGYMYVVGGRSGTSSCPPNTIVAPISANTTIASGNNPTGLGDWYETNVKYAGGRYGAAVAYNQGKLFVFGGGCTAPQGPAYTTGTISQTAKVITGNGTSWTDDFIGDIITYQDASTAVITGVSTGTSMTVDVSKTVTAGTTHSIASIRHSYTTLKAQPQIAKYSRMIDTDTDVTPYAFLLNGLDNAIGASWTMKYRTSTAANAAWGVETSYGNVTLGDVAPYTPLDGSSSNTITGRYYFLAPSIDSSQAFGYPEDVTRGPTIYDLTLFFTADPSKRLQHGKTFTGGEQQPLDTPCGQSVDSTCPHP